MIGDTSNYLALAVKPVDVATPLLQAAKIKHAQMEMQVQQMQVHRDSIGSEARGLAPLVGTPEYEPARQASTARLTQMGILGNPQAQAGWERDSSSPLGLQSLITRSQSARDYLAERQFGETARHNKATEGIAERGLDTKNITPGFVRTPAGGQAYVPGGPADPDYIAKTTGAKDKTTEAIDEREKAVKARGLDPKDPAMRSYILTGRMPREDQQPLTATDKKAILEADELVLANENVIANLKEAKDLSKSAYEGVTAAQRGWIAKQVGAQGGVDTANLNNLVIGNALTQLKSTFGAAPTEGERKILMELQGSVNEPDAVRQKIFDRAVILAEKRLAFNKNRSAELRGGTFYKPGDKSPSGKVQDRVTNKPAAANDGDPVAEARVAIAQGAPRDKVEARLKEKGIKFNPADLDLQ